MLSVTRLLNELKSILKETITNNDIFVNRDFYLFPKDKQDLFTWFCYIKVHTVSEPIIYKAIINIPTSYPTSPPTINFQLNIDSDILYYVYNPYVQLQTGKICMDILSSNYWSPAWDLQSIALALLSIMNIDRTASSSKLPPFNIECSNLLKANDYKGFYSLCKYYYTFSSYNIAEIYINEIKYYLETYNM